MAGHAERTTEAARMLRPLSVHAAQPPQEPKAGARHSSTPPLPPAPPPPVRGARHDKEDAVYAKAAALGLCGPLGKRKVDAWADSGAPDGRGTGAVLVDRLRAGVLRRRLHTIDIGRTNTALAWFEDFIRDSTRVPFVPLDDNSDIAAAAYNAETLELFAEYMRMRGSRRAGHQGEAITSDHIQTCVATVRLLRSAEAHYGIVLPDVDTNASAVFKDMRKEDGPRGGRKESHGIRAQHMRQLVQAGWDMTSSSGRDEWVVALTASNALLRGGEVGTTADKCIDPGRDLMITSVDLMAPCPESRGRPWSILWVVAIKDPSVSHRAEPIPIAKLADESDPLCTYTALAAHTERRKRQVPQCRASCKWCQRNVGTPPPSGKPPATCARANAPLFLTDEGKPYTTNDVRALARRMAAVLEIPVEAVGGKTFRIGGATDLRDALGAAAQAHIKQRGRWASDIAQIYQRALMRDQLDASRAMAAALSRDIEAMLPGWVQPATY